MKQFSVFLSLLLLVDSSGIAQDLPLCSQHMFRYIENVNVGKRDCTSQTNQNAFLKIEALLNKTGLPMNFSVCQENGLQNAIATMDSLGIRYIIYDPKFLLQFNASDTSYESHTILAHEIGHHLAAHNLDLNVINYRRQYQTYCVSSSPSFDSKKCKVESDRYLLNSRNEELEADRFAGYIMQKLGTSLSEALSFYQQIPEVSQEVMSTHPSIQKRLDAVAAGFNLGMLQKSVVGNTIDLQLIKGNDVRLKAPDADRVNRYNLLEEVHRTSFFKSFSAITEKSEISYSQGYDHGSPAEKHEAELYIGRPLVNFRYETEDELFFYGRCIYTMTYDPRITYGPAAGFHVKDNTLKILIFQEGRKSRVIYTALFSGGKISLQEVQMAFTEIYKKGFEKVMETLQP